MAGRTRKVQRGTAPPPTERLDRRSAIVSFEAASNRSGAASFYSPSCRRLSPIFSPCPRTAPRRSSARVRIHGGAHRRSADAHQRRWRRLRLRGRARAAARAARDEGAHRESDAVAGDVRLPSRRWRRRAHRRWRGRPRRRRAPDGARHQRLKRLGSLAAAVRGSPAAARHRSPRAAGRARRRDRRTDSDRVRDRRARLRPRARARPRDHAADRAVRSTSRS